MHGMRHTSQQMILLVPHTATLLGAGGKAGGAAEGAGGRAVGGVAADARGADVPAGARAARRVARLRLHRLHAAARQGATPLLAVYFLWFSAVQRASPHATSWLA